jgi:hypothetical protein
MFKRLTMASLLLSLAVLALAATATAYKYKKPAGHDCGKATFSGGFGGPPPSNVPKNATPQLDTLIVHGKISCAQAKHVMATFEMSFNTPAGGSKGISPSGWSCAFSKKEGGDECTNPSHTTIADGVVYKAPKRTKH